MRVRQPLEPSSPLIKTVYIVWNRDYTYYQTVEANQVKEGDQVYGPFHIEIERKKEVNQDAE